MNDLLAHPLGEGAEGAWVPVSEPIVVDTFGGRIHVEWNPGAAVTPLGQLPFFIEYQQISGLYEPWVSRCPLEWLSPNAPHKADVLETVWSATTRCGERSASWTRKRVSPGCKST